MKRATLNAPRLLRSTIGLITLLTGAALLAPGVASARGRDDGAGRREPARAAPARPPARRRPAATPARPAARPAPAHVPSRRPVVHVPARRPVVHVPSRRPVVHVPVRRPYVRHRPVHVRYTPVVISGRTWYCDGERYYERRGDDYRPARLPIGASVEVLPRGYRVAVRHGETYRVHDGVWFQWSSGRRAWVVVHYG